MQEVTLMQMLDARERRVWEQQRLLSEYGKTVICFTMNIAGPVKDTPLIRRSFRFGWEALEHRIPKGKILFRSVITEMTGCQAMYAVDMDAQAVKRICVSLEDGFPVGRLYDMDVLDASGRKLDREEVGGGSRDCIVCGAPGRGCASRRIHSFPELQAATNALMRRHFAQQDAKAVGALAVQSLLDEVCTTPKPGLVDCRNSGSHRDMNLFTFLCSASVLGDYFIQCVSTGIRTAADTPENTFCALRFLGLEAERQMLAATNGINTHKGAIFTLGLLCGAAGRLWQPETAWQEDSLFEEVSAMTAPVMAREMTTLRGSTAGERLYRTSGVMGARGEAAAGLPSVRCVGLPAYRRYCGQGLTHNDAGARTLLELIAAVQDTNMLHRGGADRAAEAMEKTRTLLAGEVSNQAIEALDDWFVEWNLSPGGCADLLAETYFVNDLLERRQEN